MATAELANRKDGATAAWPLLEHEIFDWILQHNRGEWPQFRKLALQSKVVKSTCWTFILAAGEPEGQTWQPKKRSDPDRQWLKSTNRCPRADGLNRISSKYSAFI